MEANRMEEKKQEGADEKKCDHEWKSLSITSIQEEMVCVKCGEKQVIYLFP